MDPSTVVLRDNNLDINMVFKKIKLEEWPAHSFLICSSLENTSPALFPERPGLIHLCQGIFPEFLYIISWKYSSQSCRTQAKYVIFLLAGFVL